MKGRNMKITSEMAVKMMKRTNGKLFSVSFEKRDGTMRDMVCRTGVTKGVKGTGMAYEPEDCDLMTVYDVEREGYRMVPYNSLKKLRVNGKEYTVV
jgi:hypothetical protein